MSELTLLRNIVANIVVGAPFMMNDTENYMSRGFNPLTNEGYGLKREASADLHRLSKKLFELPLRFKRRVTYQELFSFLVGNILREHFTKKPSEVGNIELEKLKGDLFDWVKNEAVSRKVFVPCILNTYPAPSFSIGPVKFDYIENFMPPTCTPDFNPYPEILTRMQGEEAFWMATVSLPGCSDDYGYELANLCVDLALTGLQLVVPIGWSRSMCRMNSKRGANTEILTTEANGNIAQRRSTKNAGFFLGQGSLEKFMVDRPQRLPSCGNRILSYLNGSSLVPKLETAWCDAAYWFHEALTEAIDFIATCKLETALEVLLRGTSAKTVRRLLKKAIRFAFEIGEKEPIFINPRIIAHDFVEEIVEIRSRILHGTLSTLDTETIDVRSQLEVFVGIILQVYMLELDKYILLPNPKDDLRAFFAWSETQRKENPDSRFSKDWDEVTA